MKITKPCKELDELIELHVFENRLHAVTEEQISKAIAHMASVDYEDETPGFIKIIFVWNNVTVPFEISKESCPDGEDRALWVWNNREGKTHQLLLENHVRFFKFSASQFSDETKPKLAHMIIKELGKRDICFNSTYYPEQYWLVSFSTPFQSYLTSASHKNFNYVVSIAALKALEILDDVGEVRVRATA